MLNVSSAFKTALANDWRKYLISATITLQDETVLTVTNENLMASGNSIEDGLCDDSSFGALGGAPIGSITLRLNNVDATYSAYDFTRARVVLRIGLEFENGTTEMINRGEYYVSTPTYTDTAVSLYCLDNMYRLDYPYDSDLVYPASLGTIVRDICSEFGLDLNTQNFPQNSFVVNESPANGQITYREVLSWCAEIAGCYVRCDVNGGIIFGWYNQTALEDYYNDDDESGMIPLTSIAEQNLGLDDIIITGVILKREEEETTTVTQTLPDGTVITYDQTSPVTHTYTYGTTDYAIELNSKNAFITAANAQAIVNRIGAQLTGIRYRKANVSHLSLPYMQAGDIALLTDRKGNKHVMLITRTVFTFGSYQQTASAGKTVAQNSSVQYSALTKQYSETRQEIYKEVQARQEAVAELAAKIAESGTGLYATQVESPAGSGSYIYYYHNKPDLADSDIQLVFSTVGFTVTANGTDPNPTWYGLTVDGQLIASILNTTGVNADWINTGQLSVHKTVGGQDIEMLFVDVDTGTVRISDQVPAIDDARKVATNYLTYDANTGLDVGYNGTSAKTRITGGGVEIFDGNNNSVASFGSTIRLGQTSSTYSTLSSTGFELFNNVGNSTAFFGNSVRVGAKSTAHIEMSAGTTSFYDQTNYMVGEISAGSLTRQRLSDTAFLRIVTSDSIYAGSVEYNLPQQWANTTAVWLKVTGETEGTSWSRIDFDDTDMLTVSVSQPSSSVDIVDAHAQGDVLGTFSATLADGVVTIAANYRSFGESVWEITINYYVDIPLSTYRFGKLRPSGNTGNLGFETGDNTWAVGYASSTFGIETRANGTAQTVIGQYNVPDSTSLLIIGNGLDADNQSNAFMVDGSGNTDVKGKITTHGGIAFPNSGAASYLSSPDYFVSMDAFADGGALHYTRAQDVAASIGMGTAVEHNGSSTSVPTATDTTLCNSGSLSAGTYLLQCIAQFAASSSGRRVLFLTTSSKGATINRYTQIIGAPSPSNYTQMSFTYPVTITSATTFYLRAYQNSGGAINVTGGIRVLKLH